MLRKKGFGIMDIRKNYLSLQYSTFPENKKVIKHSGICEFIFIILGLFSEEQIKPKNVYLKTEKKKVILLVLLISA